MVSDESRLVLQQLLELFFLGTLDARALSELLCDLHIKFWPDKVFWHLARDYSVLNTPGAYHITSEYQSDPACS